MQASVDLSQGKRFYKNGFLRNRCFKISWCHNRGKYDEKNEVMKWPISVAPYDVSIIPMINKNDTSALDKANKINNEFKNNDIEAIIDDTDENLSSKIKKMNLIGSPYQIIIGKQTDGDLFEFKEVGKEIQKIKLDEIIKIIKEQKIKN